RRDRLKKQYVSFSRKRRPGKPWKTNWPACGNKQRKRTAISGETESKRPHGPFPRWCTMLGVMYTPWWQVCAMWFSLLLAIFMLAAWIYRRKRPSILDFLTFISLIAIGIGLSIPSVARLPRAYYQEKDQFEWANIRASRKPESRQQ